MMRSFSVPATTVATGLAAYSMLVAGLVMLGAKRIRRYGAPRASRIAVLLFWAPQPSMTFRPTAAPDDHRPSPMRRVGRRDRPVAGRPYRGERQRTTAGDGDRWLGSACAGAGALAFLIGIAWRPAQRPVQPPRPVACADHDRCRHRARPGVPDGDAQPPSRRKNAAPRARGVDSPQE